jgi:transposase
MSATDRNTQIRRDRGASLVKALHRSEIEAAGDARALALHQADEQLDRIARRLPEALASGLSVSEIARIASVSRPTIYELRGRYSASQGDLRFAALSAVARLQPVTIQELHEAIGRDLKVVARALSDLEDQQYAEWDMKETADGVVQEWTLTSHGFGYLEAWEWHVETDEGEERP